MLATALLMTRGWVSDLAHNELSDTASASNDTDKSTATFHVNIMPTCDGDCESEQASARAKRDSRSVRRTEQRQHEHTQSAYCHSMRHIYIYTLTAAALGKYWVTWDVSANPAYDRMMHAL